MPQIIKRNMLTSVQDKRKLALEAILEDNKVITNSCLPISTEDDSVFISSSVISPQQAGGALKKS